MAGNSTYPQGKADDIEKVKAYITELIDAGFDIGGKTAGWIPKGAFQRRTESAGSVMLATVGTDGLGNYSRTTGYPTGGMSLSWEEYKLQNDRGRSFNLDGVDVMQTDALPIIDMWLGRLMNQQVIPEQDCLNVAAAYTRIKAGLAANVETYTAAGTTIIGKIAGVLDGLFDVTGIDTGYNILVNSKYKNMITNSTEVQKMRDVTGPVAAIETRVGSISGSNLTWVPGKRMKTAYTKNDGLTTGQEAGGVVAATGAQDIVAIISAPNTIQAITASQVQNIFPRGVAQGIDGSKVEMRIFYDTIISTGDLPGCYVLVEPAAP